MSVFGVFLVWRFTLKISIFSPNAVKNTEHKNSKYGHFLRNVSPENIPYKNYWPEALKNFTSILPPALLDMLLFKNLVMFKVYLFLPHWVCGICILCWIRHLFSALPFLCTCIYLAIGGVHIWSSISIFVRQVFPLIFTINISLKAVVQRCIQSLVEHLRWSFLRKQLTADNDNQKWQR